MNGVSFESRATIPASFLVCADSRPNESQARIDWLYTDFLSSIHRNLFEALRKLLLILEEKYGIEEGILRRFQERCNNVSSNPGRSIY